MIAFNGLTTLQPGVVVFGPGATGNRILRNSIHSNGGLGIDLAPGGVTLNDGNDGPTVPPYDQDTGVNGLQNFPVLTSAVISGGETTVTGILRTTATTEVVIDLYYSAVCDPSGHGEGQTWFGSISGLTTDAVGDLPFSASIAPALPAGVLVTATATTSEGTSEFSACLMALAPGIRGVASVRSGYRSRIRIRDDAWCVERRRRGGARPFVPRRCRAPLEYREFRRERGRQQSQGDRRHAGLDWTE